MSRAERLLMGRCTCQQSRSPETAGINILLQAASVDTGLSPSLLLFYLYLLDFVESTAESMLLTLSCFNSFMVVAAGIDNKLIMNSCSLATVRLSKQSN